LLMNRPATSTAGPPPRFFSLMREINQETGVAFVMVTHDDRLASQGDRILRIEDGVIEEL